MKKINHDVISRYTTESLEKFLSKNIDLRDDVLLEVLSITSSRYSCHRYPNSSMAHILALYNFDFFVNFLKSKSREFINDVLMIPDETRRTVGGWLGELARERLYSEFYAYNRSVLTLHR